MSTSPEEEKRTPFIGLFAIACTPFVLLAMCMGSGNDAAKEKASRPAVSWGEGPAACAGIARARLGGYRDEEIKSALCVGYRGSIKAQEVRSQAQLAECLGAMNEVIKEWRSRGLGTPSSQNMGCG